MSTDNRHTLKEDSVIYFVKKYYDTNDLSSLSGRQWIDVMVDYTLSYPLPELKQEAPVETGAVTKTIVYEKIYRHQCKPSTVAFLPDGTLK